MAVLKFPSKDELAQRWLSEALKRTDYSDDFRRDLTTRILAALKPFDTANVHVTITADYPPALAKLDLATRQAIDTYVQALCDSYAQQCEKRFKGAIVKASTGECLIMGQARAAGLVVQYPDHEV